MRYLVVINLLLFLCTCSSYSFLEQKKKKFVAGRSMKLMFRINDSPLKCDTIFNLLGDDLSVEELQITSYFKAPKSRGASSHITGIEKYNPSISIWYKNNLSDSISRKVENYIFNTLKERISFHEENRNTSGIPQQGTGIIKKNNVEIFFISYLDGYKIYLRNGELFIFNDSYYKIGANILNDYGFSFQIAETEINGEEITTGEVFMSYNEIIKTYPSFFSKK